MRALFRAAGSHLLVSPQEVSTEEASLLRALIAFKKLHSHDVIMTSKRLHHQILSHWREGLQHTNYGRTQTYSPEQATSPAASIGVVSWGHAPPMRHHLFSPQIPEPGPMRPYCGVLGCQVHTRTSRVVTDTNPRMSARPAILGCIAHMEVLGDS